MISRDTAIETDIKKKKEIEGDIAVEREIEARTTAATRG